MDRKAWNELSNELIPILKQLRQLSMNYRLNDMLSIAVDNDGDSWAYTFENFHQPDEREYQVTLRKDGVVQMSDSSVTEIKS